MYFVRAESVVVKTSTILLIYILSFFHSTSVWSQEFYGDWSIGFFAGTINYQGDLKPNSFTFDHSNAAFKISARKPLNRWLSFKAGFAFGEIEGADRYNRDYLKPRNLSFFTDIKEIFTVVEINVLDLSSTRFSPYLYGGVSVFHCNPWTYDNSGIKTYLQPLSTEGQGLPDYPSQKPYKLIQPALSFGLGARYAIDRNVSIGVEFSQRKTFFDYLDDVSTHYVDQSILLVAKGPKSVDLAYRGDELPGGQAYPGHGTQRGTASEMDWYYYLGITAEVNLSLIKKILSRTKEDQKAIRHSTNCPNKK